MRKGMWLVAAVVMSIFALTLVACAPGNSAHNETPTAQNEPASQETEGTAAGEGEEAAGEASGEAAAEKPVATKEFWLPVRATRTYTVIEDNAPVTESREITVEYNDAGQAVKVRSYRQAADEVTTHYDLAYNDKGYLVTMVANNDAQKTKTNFVFTRDKENRVKSIASQNEDYLVTYNDDGTIKSVVNKGKNLNNPSVFFLNDNRVAEYSTSAPGKPAKPLRVYAYNGLGQCIQETFMRDDGSTILSYAWNEDGQIVSITTDVLQKDTDIDSMNEYTGYSFTKQYNYDELGRVANITEDNRAPIVFTYDEQGNMTGASQDDQVGSLELAFEYKKFELPEDAKPFTWVKPAFKFGVIPVTDLNCFELDVVSETSLYDIVYFLPQLNGVANPNI